MLDRMAIAHGVQHMNRHATCSNSKNSPPTLPGDETPRCHRAANLPAGPGAGPGAEPGNRVSWLTDWDLLSLEKTLTKVLGPGN